MFRGQERKRTHTRKHVVDAWPSIGHPARWLGSKPPRRRESRTTTFASTSADALYLNAVEDLCSRKMDLVRARLADATRRRCGPDTRPFAIRLAAPLSCILHGPHFFKYDLKILVAPSSLPLLSFSLFFIVFLSHYFSLVIRSKTLTLKSTPFILYAKTQISRAAPKDATRLNKFIFYILRYFKYVASSVKKLESVGGT